MNQNMNQQNFNQMPQTNVQQPNMNLQPQMNSMPQTTMQQPQINPQPQSNIEEPKNGKKGSKNGVILFLLLVIIGLCGYIAYDKFFAKKDTKEDTSEKEEEKQAEKEENKQEDKQEEKEEQKQEEKNEDKQEEKMEELTIDSPIVKKLFQEFSIFPNTLIGLMTNPISDITKASIAYYSLDDKDIQRSGETIQFSAKALRTKIRELFGQNTSYKDVKKFSYGIEGEYDGGHQTYYSLNEETDMYVSKVYDGVQGIRVARYETLIDVKQEGNKLTLVSSASTDGDAQCGKPYYEYQYTLVKEQSSGNYIFESKQQTKYIPDSKCGG